MTIELRLAVHSLSLYCSYCMSLQSLEWIEPISVLITILATKLSSLLKTLLESMQKRDDSFDEPIVFEIHVKSRMRAIVNFSSFTHFFQWQLLSNSLTAG